MLSGVFLVCHGEHRPIVGHVLSRLMGVDRVWSRASEAVGGSDRFHPDNPQKKSRKMAGI